MAKKFNNDELFDSDFGKPLMDFFNILIEGTRESKKELKGLAAELKKVVDANKLNDGASVQKLNQQREKATKIQKEKTILDEEEIALLKEKERVRKAIITTNAKIKNQATAENKELIETREQLNKQNKELRESVRLDKLKEGSLKKLRVELKKARDQFDSLGGQQERNSKRGKELISTINRLNKEILENELATGRAQRQVGDYGKALEGVKGTLLNVAAALGAGSFIENVFQLNQELAKAEQLANKFFDSTTENIKELASEADTLATVYGTDVNEVLRTANVLQNEFGLTGSQALNLIDEGFQKGLNSSGQFLDNVTEYSTQLRLAGLSAEEAFAIISETEERGVFSDKGVDAIKEATISLRELTPATRDALAAIGVSADQVQADIQSGAKTYFEVIQEISTETAKFGETSEQAGMVLADVFRGAGEDAGAFIFQLGELNTNFEDVESTLPPLTQATNALKREWREIFKDLNDGAGVSSRLTSVFRFLARNLRTILKVVGLAAGAFLSYKTAVTATNVAIKAYEVGTKAAGVVTALFTKGLKGATTSFKGLNTVMKANVIGGVVSLITTAAAAMSLFGDETEEAAEKTKDLDKNLEEAGASTEARFRIREQLSKRQLENLKSDIETLVQAREDAALVEQALQKESNERSAEEIKNIRERIKETNLATQDELKNTLLSKAGRQDVIERQEKFIKNSKEEIKRLEESIKPVEELSAQNGKYKDQIEEINRLLSRGSGGGKGQIGLIQEVTEEIKRLQEAQKNSRDEDRIKALEAEIKLLQIKKQALTDLTGATKELSREEKARQDFFEADKKARDKEEKDRIKRENKQLADADKLNDQVLKADEKRRQEEKKAAQERLQAQQEFFDESFAQAQMFFEKQSQLRVEAFDQSIQDKDEEISELKQLAAQGDENARKSLALEAQNARTLRNQREAEIRRQTSLSIVLAGLEAFISFTRQGSQNPAGQATEQTGDLLSNLSGFTDNLGALTGFFGGTERVGDDMKDSKFSDGQDGYLARLHKNERVMNEVDSSKVTGLSNKELANAGMMYKQGMFNAVHYALPPQDFAVKSEKNSKEIVSELKNVQKEIRQNKSETKIYVDQVADKLARDVMTMHNKKTEHFKKGKLF